MKIYAARDRVFAALDAQRPDPIAERGRMLALFEADQLTTANLDTLHQQLEQQRGTVRQAIHRAIVETHDALTPAQRKVVTEYFRTQGPGPFMACMAPAVSAALAASGGLPERPGVRGRGDRGTPAGHTRRGQPCHGDETLGVKVG